MIRSSLRPVARTRDAGVASLALALTLFGAPAWAQDGGLRPADAPPAPAPAGDALAPTNPPQAPATADTPTVEGGRKDPGGWKGGAPAPAPAPAGVPEASPPAAPGGDPLGPAAKPADPVADEETRRKEGRIIDKNYDEAIRIYEGVLKNEGEPIESLDNRIATNEKLIASHKKRLATANETKRRLQVELFNRTFYLKQQKDKGAIPEDTYNKLIKQEEKKYADKSAQARSDCDFYEKEIADAEKRLAELRAERRVQVTTIQTNKVVAGGTKKAAPKKPGEALIGSLKDRLEKLSAFDSKNTMDTAPIPVVRGPSAAPAPEEK